MTTALQMQEEAQALPAVGSLLDRRVMRPVECKTVAALYVEPKGCYVGVPSVDAWDEARDARTYAGPHPVVAHPPCQRWGRFWHGSTRKPHQYKLGDDGGCFEAALHAVLTWGGVLEHPAHSKAWDAFGLLKPTMGKGWQRSDMGHPSSGYWVVLRGARALRPHQPEADMAAGEHLQPASGTELDEGRATLARMDGRALRLREGQAYRRGGDGGREEQDRDPQRHARAFPRPAAFDSAAGA